MAENGPRAISIASITDHTNALIGSIYHRFSSRRVLLAELWLRVVKSFQKEFLELLYKGDGLSAALFTLCWVKNHPNEGQVLLVYRREELVAGDWPDELKKRLCDFLNDLDEDILKFTERVFGRVTKESIARVRLVLIDLPSAAARGYLLVHQPPPIFIDRFVKNIYCAIVDLYE
ncbi:MAG: TetR/AcrR family transcriptional regulator [Deltaproteobacteria bacterium]|nr:TetR/AcrR family transcriptional regulator [Deltaproteobacteria bacterium]